MRRIQYQMKTRIGPVYLVASPNGLEGVFLDPQSFESVKDLRGRKPEEEILSEVVKQLEEYFDGKRKQFDLVLNASGTLFQKQVWKALTRIPYGKTVSYLDVAKKIKNPKAARAVGSANGKNRFCIIIPCHRVIAADGTMGGYSGGIEIKRQLLDLEKR